MQSAARFVSCSNSMCEQYRIQHKNMTLKCNALTRELEQLKRTQINTFNNAVEQNSITQIRDPISGAYGLMVKGEVMTADKIKLKMDMAAHSHAALLSTQQRNHQLVSENTALKQANETAQRELRRMEAILSKFEKTRKYDNFTNETHKATLDLNHELADQVDHLERELHILREENEALQQYQRRIESTHSRRDDDEDDGSISAYITPDGRIPAQCPCNAEGCAERYEAQVLLHANPADAFKAHMHKLHRCMHCKHFIKNTPKHVHEQACELKGMAKIPRKRRALDDD